MKEPLFKVGEKVILLGDTNDDYNEVGWCDSMDDIIGDVMTVKSWETNGSDNFMYKLEEDEDDYWYDEEWLSGVMKNPSQTDKNELDNFFNDLGGE